MKRMFNIVMTLLATLLMVGCTEDRQTQIPEPSFPFFEDAEPEVSKFETKKIEGVWKLLKDGEPFYINGAATNNFYGEVAKWGGNAVRTYGIKEEPDAKTEYTTKMVLDEAYENGLFVNVGLGMKDCTAFDYSNPANADAIKEQLEKHRTWVRRFRSHPAVMCWSIGNEFEAGDKATNEVYFKYVEEVAKMIHEEDPNHPTTIAFSNSDVNNKLKPLMQIAPSIDILSVNSYYNGVGGVATNVASAGWDKPWMITEFGPIGTWSISATTNPKKLPWVAVKGKTEKEDKYALEEMTSTEKAAFYSKIWKEDIKAKENKGCIGSFIFLWGFQTHGEVLSWYGLFDKQMNAFGGVDEISACWTGKTIEKPAPRIENRTKMTLNGKISTDGVKVVANSADNTATVEATSPTGATLTYRWIINKEGEALANGSMPDGIEGLIADNTKATISFKAPAAGAYRLYVFATDEANHKVAMACIPFLAE